MKTVDLAEVRRLERRLLRLGAIAEDNENATIAADRFWSAADKLANARELLKDARKTRKR